MGPQNGQNQWAPGPCPPWPPPLIRACVFASRVCVYKGEKESTSWSSWSSSCLYASRDGQSNACKHNTVQNSPYLLSYILRPLDRKPKDSRVRISTNGESRVRGRIIVQIRCITSSKTTTHVILHRKGTCILYIYAYLPLVARGQNSNFACPFC